MLREVARRLGSSVRAADLVFRYGGEEFLLLLPDTDAAGAEAVGQTILDRVGAAPFELPGGASVSVTVSIGVAGWAAAGTSADAVVTAADAALYDAKQTGRNRVVVAS